MKTSIKLLTLLFAASLTVGCNGGGNGGGNGGSDGFNFDYDELETEQQIHTEKQNDFLNFKTSTGKSYYEITQSDLNGYEAYGDRDVSTPNRVTLNWEYEVPSNKELTRFEVTFGQEEDLSDGYVVKGTKNNTISFYNPFIGTNYFKVTAKFSDDTEEESDIETFKVQDIAPRNLYAGNMPNVRDMGGRATVAGGRLRQGLIYRGAGNRFNGSEIDSDCRKILTEQLKIKTEINVADGTSNNISLEGTTVQNCFMAYGAVPYSNLARNSVRIRQIMNILADENNYPVFYHCRIGTDRTGITGMMINGLLGVDFEECLQDYLFSNFAPIDNQRYPHKSSDPNGDDIAKYIDALQELPGSTWQEKVYLALRMIGCPAAQLDKIIDIMTIGPKADFSDHFKVGGDSDLTSTASKATSSDFKAPASYYPVSNGGSVTYTVDTTAGNKDVIVYLGYTGSVSQNDTSSRLSSYLSLKIDGADKTISSTRSLWTAGFGSTQQDGRIGYMFNILGSYDFTAGSHTIQVGVKSGTFNIATVGVANH